MSGILPLVFQLNDLDWWLVPPDKAATLADKDKAAVAACLQDIDLAVIQMLRTLDGFHFSQVDADVWRNVYQDYLPGEERQRLGGV